MPSALDPVRTARHLAALLTGYLFLIIGVITLAPFQFRIPDHANAQWIVLGDGWIADVLLNVVLFLPVGFVLRRGLGGAADRLALWVLLAGAMMSGGIEMTQLFIPSRYTTFSDVVSNASGAWLGALLSDLVSNRVGTGRVLVGRLRLDVPLMGVVYLLLPLLWLDGLVAPHGIGALWSVLPLAVAGALALSAVSEQGAAECALTALAWFLIGAVPLLRTAPVAALLGIPLTGAAAWAGRYHWARVLRRERRLEPQVVRVILPLVILHLVVIGFTPGGLTLSGGPETARLEILRWVGRLAAFTILGYLVAEARGRRLERLVVLVLPPALAALLVEGMMALVWHEGGGAMRHLLAPFAAMVGGTLYHLQRSHILAVLSIVTGSTSSAKVPATAG